jgi:hypothetical protein
MRAEVQLVVNCSASNLRGAAGLTWATSSFIPAAAADLVVAALETSGYSWLSLYEGQRTPSATFSSRLGSCAELWGLLEQEKRQRASRDP